MSGTAVDHKALADRMHRAMSTRDRELMRSVLADDFVEEYPQSGERVRGFDNYWSIGEHYPGGLPDAEDEVLETRPNAAVKLVAPSFALVSVEGAGNSGTATLRITYPDRSVWWAVMLYRLRDGRIVRMTTFFAPEYRAPEWRSQWVERM